MAFSTKEMLSLNDWQWQPLILQKSDALGEDDFHGHGGLPSRELTYPTLGKGKSSSKCHFWWIC